MKKILTSCLLLIMVLFTSCSNDVLNYQDIYEKYFDKTIEFSSEHELNITQYDNIIDIEENLKDESIENIIISFNYYNDLLANEQKKVNELLSKMISKKSIVFFGDFQYEQIVSYVKSIDSKLYLQMKRICSDDNNMMKAIAFDFDNINNHYTFLRYYSDNKNVFNDNEAKVVLSTLEEFHNEYEFNDYTQSYIKDNIFGKVLDVYDYENFYMTVHNDLFHIDNNQKWGIYTESKIISNKGKIYSLKISHNCANDNGEELISFYPNPSSETGDMSNDVLTSIADTIPYKYYSSYRNTSISTGEVDDNPNSIYWCFNNKTDIPVSATFNNISVWHKDTYGFSNQLKYDLCISGEQYEFSNSILIE